MRTTGLSSRAPHLTQVRLRTCSFFKKDLIKSVQVVLKDRRNQRHNRRNRRQRWRWTWRWQEARQKKPMVLRALISAVDGARRLKTAVDIEQCLHHQAACKDQRDDASDTLAKVHAFGPGRLLLRWVRVAAATLVLVPDFVQQRAVPHQAQMGSWLR